MIKLIRFSFLSSLMVCFVIPTTSFSASSIFKWTDEKGNVHYGDMHPDGQDAKEMKIQRFKGQTPTASPQSKANDLEKDQAASSKIKALNLQKQVEMKAEEQRCNTAKKNLTTLKNNSRIKIRGEDGNYRYLSPEEISKKMQESQKAVDESCKK